jgi:hypothetical protein
MFGLKRDGTVIGNGLKIVGNVTAEGLVEINGQIEGDLHCTSLIVSPSAQVVGSITAERVVVSGRVEGPIQGGDVVLKPRLAIFITNLLPLRRGPTLKAAPRKPMALMGASSLPLAKTGHGKFRVGQILWSSDSRRNARRATYRRMRPTTPCVAQSIYKAIAVAHGLTLTLFN